MRLLLALLLAALPVKAVTVVWAAVPEATGYFVYFIGQTTIAFDVRTNRLSATVPPGTWTACVTAYSTNSTDMVPVEGDPSNSVMLYVPRPPEIEVQVDFAFVTPVIRLASNPVARVTIYLQRTTNWASWTEGVPLFQYDVGDRPGSFYRTRMTVERLP